jgi:molybdate transport system substrate-binding protein
MLGRWLALVLVVGCAPESGPPASSPPARVAAAADLALAFEELGQAFEGRVSFTFGSSGLLASQIRHGAPFDLFAAASASFADQAIAAGCDASSWRAYGRGRLVLWTRSPSPAAIGELAQARFARIAIANPEHAPYGMAARQALQAAGVWPAVKSRVVLADNVRQALQHAESGNAEAAIVALSLMTGERRGHHLLLDEELHDPLEQVLVVCPGGENEAEARAFSELAGSETGQAILARHGFGRP